MSSSSSSSTTLQEYKQQLFESSFDGTVYMNTYYQPSDPVTGGINRRHLSELAHTLKSLELQGERVLEVGCGPYLGNCLVLSQFFDQVYLSDFNSGMRKPIKQWLEGEPTDFDYSHVMSEASNILGDASEKIVADARRKVKDVLKCDVHSPQILDKASQKFPVVYTRFCIDSCSPDLESYNAAVKNVAKVIKDGGYFIQQSFYDHRSERDSEGNWNLGEKVIKDIRLTKPQLTKAVEDCGMSMVHWRETHLNSDEHCQFENTSTYLLVAKKDN